MSAIADSQEERRVTALHDLSILDTPPEERFDRLTRVASALFDASIALVSLIDVSRQWHKSCIGLPNRELPRTVSFCSHGIRAEGPMVVPDAQQDPRFVENPLVTGPPHIRFYAGHPLHAPGGEKLGMLCVADQRPRTMTPAELGLLADLASVAEKELANVELAEARREADRAREQLRLIVDSAGEGILRTGPGGEVRFANPAALELLRAGSAELLERGLSQAMPRWTIDGCPLAPGEDEVLATLADGRPRQVRRIVGRFDGSRFSAGIVVTRLEEDRPGGSGAVILLQDESERHTMERLKDELMSVVGHELRTPLTSIRGCLGLLDSGVGGELPPQAQRLVTVALSNSVRLSKLIDDILDLERLRAGRAELGREAVPVRQIVREALESVAMVAAEAQVGITPVVDAGAEVCGDGLRLVQALTNLVANAVKFSPPGGEVHVRTLARRGEVLFEVEDRGRGIPPGQAERIFERFAQVESGDARKLGGAGLGLAITRSIVELHGGRIGVESTPGHGSTFYFTVPAQPPADLPAS